jgi:hypothetical protein
VTVTPVQQQARILLRAEALRLMSEDVKAALAQPVAKREAALKALAEESGGKLWFSGGANCVRLGGVSATSTVSYIYAADNWLKAAARKREKLIASAA